MGLGTTEILIIAGVIILLFGARKLPEMARSIGKSAKAFKEETKGLRGDGSEDKDATAESKPAQETTDATPAEPQQLPEAQPQSSTNNVTNGVEQAKQNDSAS